MHKGKTSTVRNYVLCQHWLLIPPPHRWPRHKMQLNGGMNLKIGPSAAVNLSSIDEKARMILLKFFTTSNTKCQQFTSLYLACIACMIFYKLDGVGPVDNRPCTDKLHHFVKEKKKKKKKRRKKIWHVTRDTWHVTCDTWHVTRDKWHMTYDTWHIVWDEHSLKISAL